MNDNDSTLLPQSKIIPKNIIKLKKNNREKYPYPFKMYIHMQISQDNTQMHTKYCI